MTISDNLSSLFPLTAAAGLIPSRHQGKKTHATTLYRWTTTGVRGIKLDYVQCGGTRMTTLAMLNDFFRALTNLSSGNEGEIDADLAAAVAVPAVDEQPRESNEKATSPFAG